MSIDFAIVVIVVAVFIVTLWAVPASRAILFARMGIGFESTAPKWWFWAGRIVFGGVTVVVLVLLGWVLTKLVSS